MNRPRIPAAVLVPLIVAGLAIGAGVAVSLARGSPAPLIIALAFVALLMRA